ncbi:MAG: 2,3-bisphosphoglycerate-independent phosphoglycerate mutase [Bacteroidales bacterium]
MNKKVLLMILDGWGEGVKNNTNAIFTQGQPNIDALRKKYPVSHLIACGEDVGLPDGQMGNSEVGHLNIGAGRIVYQDLVKVNKACQAHSLLENKEIKAVFDYVKKTGKKLHFMGLTSHGGVHSSLNHLYEFMDTAKLEGISNMYLHCMMDGRDCDPKSGKGIISEVQEHCNNTGAYIASIIGRYYSMDRDKRWLRVKEGYDLMVNGVGKPFTDPIAAIQKSYDKGITDEFIKPLVAVDSKGKAIAKIEEGDAVIFYNFRNDRAREITSVLTQNDITEQEMHTIPLYFCCLTPYDNKFKKLHILFPKENVKKTIGEVVANAGKNQLRIAETEKYAHVTFFFSGGREELFKNESRILVNSPKVATYDLQPEMSAYEISEKLIAQLQEAKQDMIILNFANGDMVGHTGVFEAIKKAVKTIDICTKNVVEAARKSGYTVLITADHGNADHAVNADGTPNTAHSLNPVPFIVVDDEIKKVKDGRLADISPTILKLMGIPQPKEMTGNSLV